jgi:hypothetical protein
MHDIYMDFALVSPVLAQQRPFVAGVSSLSSYYHRGNGSTGPSLTCVFGRKHNLRSLLSSFHPCLVRLIIYSMLNLLGGLNKFDLTRTANHPPIFTPVPIHFTLVPSYSLIAYRSYDLSTILHAALYLDLPTLHDEIHAHWIAQEMVHGL